MRSGLGILEEDALNIYTDGSSYPNKQEAAGVGVRFVWVNGAGDEEMEDYCPVGWEKATIDEMEIEACIVALREAPRLFTDMSRFKRVLIVSDSMYVAENFSKAVNVWPKRAWRGVNGRPVENIDQWKRLRKEVQACPIRVAIEWVKAHRSNVHNRAADKLAKRSAEMPFNRPFSISATTKKWSDRKTKRGCVPVSGQEIRIRIISREYKRHDKSHEYRYEVIDPNDPNYKDVDFVRSKESLSRNKCYLVRLNADQNNPRMEAILEELDPADYEY